MPRYAYVNGRYCLHNNARVHIEDRGYQFADGVYEVISIHNGGLVDEKGHLDRLDRSLNELSMQWPVTRRVLEMIMRQLIRRNRVRNGLIYVQITRGVAPRDFRFPADAAPSLVMTTRHAVHDPNPLATEGVGVITIPDIRWKRRDIKTIALLPQALGKQKAFEAGAFEAWQVDDDGAVTEGCSSNAWIVTKDGVLVTRNATSSILNGITRQSVLAIAERHGLRFEERPFTVEESHNAREAFLTSATTYVMPVVRIDDHPVANGAVGSLTADLRQNYIGYALNEGRSPGAPDAG